MFYPNIVSFPFKLPETSRDSVQRIHPNDIESVSSGAPCKPVAQYKSRSVMSADLTLTVLDWRGSEYEEEYVILLNEGDVTPQSIHNPYLVDGVFSRDTLIQSINMFIRYSDRKTEEVVNILDDATSERWQSKEEYEEYVGEKHKKAIQEIAIRNLHEEAREDWEEEKERRRILRELKKNQHEFHIPEMPKVTQEVQELKERYVNEEITLFEFEQKVDEVLEEA